MMRRHICLLGTLCAAASQPVYAASCTAEQLAEILAPATAAAPAVEMRCSATLPANSRISKRLLFSGAAASHLTLNCNGSTIAPANAGTVDAVLIRSQQQQGQWQRPQHISLNHCRIEGSLRIQGMAANGEGAALRASSQQPGHTERAQAAAPTDIKLNRLTIIGQGRVPLYLAPGVTQVTLSGSRVGGYSRSVALYLDAESARNHFEGNTIDSATGRELIAIDGSADNTFRRNRFSSLNKGGLYFYRNCGEGGTVRHQAPTGNTVSDNTFFYRKYRGPLPAVWLGARNGNRSYCQADAGYGFGSSSDNADFADRNTITDNRIYRLSPQKMLRDHGRDNRISGNQTVQ